MCELVHTLVNFRPRRQLIAHKKPGIRTQRVITCVRGRPHFSFNGWFGRHPIPVPPAWLPEVKVPSAQRALPEVKVPSAERILPQVKGPPVQRGLPDKKCWTPRVRDPIRIDAGKSPFPRAHPPEGYSSAGKLV